MRSLSLLSFASLALLATAVPVPGGDDKKDDDVDIEVASKFTEKEHQKEVSIKEVCYLELFLDIEKRKIEFEKEVLIKDEYGKDVFLRDGFKKDEKNVEFYFKEFCYKDFHFSEHKEETNRADLVQLDSDQLSKLIKDKEIDINSINKAKDEKKDKQDDKDKQEYRLRARGFDDSFGDRIEFDDYGKGFDFDKKDGFDFDKEKFGELTLTLLLSFSLATLITSRPTLVDFDQKKRKDDDKNNFRKFDHKKEEFHFDSRKDGKDKYDRDDRKDSFWRA
ncbi:hypothetical protein JCM11251_002446 [Rhodosporidiobolus azoricus]